MSPLLKHILEALSLDHLREDRFIRPAREVTYLYFQIQRIYPGFSEQQARYLSLLVHSEETRDSISEACISSFFQMEGEKPWEKIAMAYARIWNICLSPLSSGVLYDRPLSPLAPQRAINVEDIRQEVKAGSRKFSGKILRIPEETLKLWCRNYDREATSKESERTP